MLTVWDAIDSCIIDEDVQREVLLLEGMDKINGGLEGGQVQGKELHLVRFLSLPLLSLPSSTQLCPHALNGLRGDRVCLEH